MLPTHLVFSLISLFFFHVQSTFDLSFKPMSLYLNKHSSSSPLPICSVSPHPLSLYCAVEGQWLEWGAWSKCSVTCNTGTQLRQRRCSPSVHGWAECKGPHQESRECSNPSCSGTVDKQALGDGTLCAFKQPYANTEQPSENQRKKSFPFSFFCMQFPIQIKKNTLLFLSFPLSDLHLLPLFTIFSNPWLTLILITYLI